MSTSEPIRTCMARPAPSRSKFTRWPWRSIRKIEPSSASAARTNSAAVGVADDDALTGLRVEGADHALHGPAPVRASAPCRP